MKTILVCDDDKDIVSSISIYLQGSGFNVVTAYNGLEALSQVAKYPVDLIVLDIMMPQLDGIQTTLKIREKSNVPIILVTAMGQDNDIILGLNIGADDYVVKPFNPLELVARVNSLLRRVDFKPTITQDTIVIDGLVIDNAAKKVSVDDQTIKLTPTEYKILYLLASNPNHVFSADDIYNRVWNEDNFVQDNVIAVHIRKIREKIEINPKNPKYLKVVWGVGYKIVK